MHWRVALHSNPPGGHVDAQKKALTLSLVSGLLVIGHFFIDQPALFKDSSRDVGTFVVTQSDLVD
jgi:hypothetical protein